MGTLLKGNDQSRAWLTLRKKKMHLKSSSILTADPIVPRMGNIFSEFSRTGHIAAYGSVLFVGDGTNVAVVDAHTNEQLTVVAQPGVRVGNDRPMEVNGFALTPSALWVCDEKNQRIVVHTLESAQFTAVTSQPFLPPAVLSSRKKLLPHNPPEGIAALKSEDSRVNTCGPLPDNSIRVVKMSATGTLQKAILNESEYTKNENGQISLPEGYTSAGYYERMTDPFGKWEDLPPHTLPDNSPHCPHCEIGQTEVEQLCQQKNARQIIRKWHPDKNEGACFKCATDRFKWCQKAREQTQDLPDLEWEKESF